MPVHSTFPVAAVPSAEDALSPESQPPRDGWRPERGGFNRAKAEKFLMCLSSMDLRIVMRVLDVVGKMGATKVVKRRAALEVMAREDVSDVALEALMDDHALNGSSTPRRALRSRHLSRSAHHAHDGPPQVTGSHEAGGAGDILVGAGPIPSRAGAPPDIVRIWSESIISRFPMRAPIRHTMHRRSIPLHLRLKKRCASRR